MNNICLPWNGGPRLISVLDMKDYLASRLPGVCEQITHCMFDAASIGGKKPEEAEALKRNIGARLQSIVPDLDFLGLGFTKVSVERVISELATSPAPAIIDRVSVIDERLRDELGRFHLLYLSADERRFYSQPNLFGESFGVAFPNANFEITEAGNCFALGRYTAAVFHLMRATESGLVAVYVGVGLPAPIKTTWSWHSILADIEKQIKANDAATPVDPKWKSQSSFFKTALGFLFAIKQPLRNETMHLETTYGENETARVFDVVRSFLTHLATKLKEVS